MRSAKLDGMPALRHSIDCCTLFGDRRLDSKSKKYNSSPLIIIISFRAQPHTMCYTSKVTSHDPLLITLLVLTDSLGLRQYPAPNTSISPSDS